MSHLHVIYINQSEDNFKVYIKKKNNFNQKLIYLSKINIQWLVFFYIDQTYYILIIYVHKKSPLTLLFIHFHRSSNIIIRYFYSWLFNIVCSRAPINRCQVLLLFNVGMEFRCLAWAAISFPICPIILRWNICYLKIQYIWIY